MSRLDDEVRHGDGLGTRAGASLTMRTRLALLVSAGALALAPGSALAAPAGPEGPSNCTFVNATTTCAHTTETTTIETSPPDSEGCITTWTSVISITSYTAHRGTYNSRGKTVEAPPGFGTGSATVSVDCPN